MAKKIMVLANLVVIALAVHTLVDTFYKYIEADYLSVEPAPAMAAPDPGREERRAPMRHSQYTIIEQRDLFGTLPPKPEDEKPVDNLDDLKDTSLSIKLLGTIAGDPANSWAVIEDSRTRKQGLYGVGESVQGAEVKSILRRMVVLRVAGEDQVLRMEQSKGVQAGGGAKRGSGPVAAAPTGPQQFTVRRTDVERSLSNINKLMTQVRVRPAFDQGKPDGLSVNRIRPGSIFNKMGLQNGDIIQGVNEKDIKSVDDVMSLYKQLRTSEHIDLRVKRGGVQQRLEYRFE